jgi:hypothetical protein
VKKRILVIDGPDGPANSVGPRQIRCSLTDRGYGRLSGNRAPRLPPTLPEGTSR